MSEEENRPQPRKTGTPARREIPFRAFNPDSQIQRRNAKLENWEQPGACYFVTFRLGDSIPQSVLEEWRSEREEWIEQNPKPWSADKIREHEKRFTDRQDEWLDRGFGECHLRDGQIRSVVTTSLWRFDSKRYHIDAFVIMPNHVHLLWQMEDDSSNANELRSLKGATARACNSVLGMTGTFWMQGSYNRIVRDDAELSAYRDYITANPAKASLADDEYCLECQHVLKTYGYL